MATLQKRGKRWRALVRVTGHPARSKTFASKTKARQWANKLEDAIKAGSVPGAQAERTFAHTLPKYLEELPQRKLKTEDQIRSHLEDWKRVLGAYSLATITPDLIADERNRLLRTLSPATVNRRLAALSGFFAWCTGERGILKTNPVSGIVKPKEPRGRVRFLSDDERGRLLGACKRSRDPRLYPLVLLALATGARQGELLGLRWPDVDLERGLAFVHETKNSDRRALAIAGRSAEVLRKLGRVRRFDTDLIFANASGKAPFPRKPWTDALAEAKIDDFRFHDLRHTAASYLAMSGATLAELAEILGHRTLAMVKRYAHLTDQHTSRVVKRMNLRMLGEG